MASADLEFRKRLSELGSEPFFMENAGKPSKPLVELWVIASGAALQRGMDIRDAIDAFMAGYNSYYPSIAPWAVLTADAISGISDGQVDVGWMLRTAGAAFAAYGVEPKFKTS